MTADDVQVFYKRCLLAVLSFILTEEAGHTMYCTRITVVLLAVIPCLVLSEEIPNLLPGDVAPSFVLQAKEAIEGTEVLLKYGGNDSNIDGPIVFLAHTNRSGFLERLLSDPDCFKTLMENSPDNTNYVFLFYATPSSSVKDAAVHLANRFKSAMYAYYLR